MFFYCCWQAFHHVLVPLRSVGFPLNKTKERYSFFQGLELVEAFERKTGRLQARKAATSKSMPFLLGSESFVSLHKLIQKPLQLTKKPT